MSLLTGAPGVHRARNSVKLAEAQRQAVAMAVLTKLHLAYQQYLDAGKEYGRARALAEVDERLYAQLSGRAAAEAQNELEPIVAGVASVASSLRRYESYSNMQAALGRLYDTVGIDIDPADLVRLDAAVLGRKTEEIMAIWQRGDGTSGPTAPPPTARAGCRRRKAGALRSVVRQGNELARGAVGKATPMRPPRRAGAGGPGSRPAAGPA